jgi:CRISPR-associated protein Cmr1
MPVAVARYHQRERLTFDCKVLTPMFLGGANNQQAHLSAAPFKAALRYWWRVSGVHDTEDPKSLFEQESSFFGAANQEFGKSPVQVRIGAEMPPQPSQDAFKYTATVGEGKTSVPALLYLANIGLLKRSRGELAAERPYFPVDSSFQVHLSFPSNLLEQLMPALSCFQQLGSVGGRSRNAWGSLEVTPSSSLGKTPVPKAWEHLMRQDFPTGLGTDGRLLCWSQAPRKARTWESTMYELAKLYTQLRGQSFMKEKVASSRFKGKHLLGSPIKGGPGARSASALRFTLRKRGENLVPIIVHVPCQNPAITPVDVQSQIAVWKQVHHFLDQAPGWERETLQEAA